MSSRGNPGMGRMEDETGGPTSLSRDAEAVLRRARGHGRPLEASLRRVAGAYLGHDFSRVRIHTGPSAHELNRQLGSTAFTVGSDIFFARDAYAPGTAPGRRRIVHELVHVVQQRHEPGAASSGPLRVGPEDDALEREAREIAARFESPDAKGSRGRPCISRGVASPAVIRRTLADQVDEGAPDSPFRSCLSTTLWWVWREKNSGKGTYLDFAKSLGDKTVTELTKELVQAKGQHVGSKKKKKGGINVSPGSVIVFTETVASDPAHSCLCGNDGDLYGITQGNFLEVSDAQGFSHAPPTKILFKKWHVYAVPAQDVMDWAETNL